MRVIDGQQRRTTFQLPLAATRGVAKANTGCRSALNDGIMSKLEHHQPDTDAEALGPRPSDEDGMIWGSVAVHAFFKAKIEVHVKDHGTFDGYQLDDEDVDPDHSW